MTNNIFQIYPVENIFSLENNIKLMGLAAWTCHTSNNALDNPKEVIKKWGMSHQALLDMSNLYFTPERYYFLEENRGYYDLLPEDKDRVDRYADIVYKLEKKLDSTEYDGLDYTNGFLNIFYKAMKGSKPFYTNFRQMLYLMEFLEERKVDNFNELYDFIEKFPTYYVEPKAENRKFFVCFINSGLSHKLRTHSMSVKQLSTAQKKKDHRNICMEPCFWENIQEQNYVKYVRDFVPANVIPDFLKGDECKKLTKGMSKSRVQYLTFHNTDFKGSWKILNFPVKEKDRIFKERINGTPEYKKDVHYFFNKLNEIWDEKGISIDKIQEILKGE